jgi:hypothetical protein
MYDPEPGVRVYDGSQPAHICTGSCLSWENGARMNPMWEAPWHPPNQTGWKQVQTYGSVDRRPVPGDDGPCLFQLTHLMKVPYIKRELRIMFSAMPCL